MKRHNLKLTASLQVCLCLSGEDEFAARDKLLRRRETTAVDNSMEYTVYSRVEVESYRFITIEWLGYAGP